MNATPTSPENQDELDRLFSDFFKAQLKQPWPAAPRPVAEPSELAATRATPAPQNQPAARDSTARARFTLAASVALVVGASWFLSNGFQAGTRGTDGTNAPGTPGLFQNGTAKDQDILDGVQKAKANGNAPEIKPEKIDLGKGE